MIQDGISAKGFWEVGTGDLLSQQGPGKAQIQRAVQERQQKDVAVFRLLLEYKSRITRMCTPSQDPIMRTNGSIVGQRLMACMASSPAAPSCRKEMHGQERHSRERDDRFDRRCPTDEHRAFRSLWIEASLEALEVSSPLK